MNGVLMFGWSTAVIFEVLRDYAADGRGSRPGYPASQSGFHCVLPVRRNPVPP
jgi:hypothetical protein